MKCGFRMTSRSDRALTTYRETTDTLQINSGRGNRNGSHVLNGILDDLHQVRRGGIVEDNLVLLDQRRRRRKDLQALGAEGVLPGGHIESSLRVFKQFTLTLPRG